MRSLRLPKQILLCLCVTIPVCAQPLRTSESRYYILHTDLPELESREAQLRLTRMAEEYFARTTGFAGKLKDKLPFYLYANPEDYYKAGGAPNSAGFFTGEKLMALTLRRSDGLISLSTWQVVQHEGFHQFAQTVIGDKLPMWLDEGLAEYFGQGLFTGDGFVIGLVPQARLARVQQMLLKSTHKPLPVLLAITRPQWNEKIDLANYDQAWSLVHFLSHTGGEARSKAFAAFIRDAGKGVNREQSLARHLGPVDDLEKEWKKWWLNQPDHPSADLFAKATLSILTSFLARAHAAGQSFESFEAFSKTAPGDLKQPEDQWLPTGLFQMAVNESIKMRSGGDALMLVQAGGSLPQIQRTLRSGTRLAGRFTLNDRNGVEQVQVDTLYESPTRPVIRTTTRAVGEMLQPR